jgi:hypothetical protein
MIHPQYASAEVRRDRKAARSPGPSFAVDLVTGGPFVIFDPRQSSVDDDDGKRRDGDSQ